MGTGYLWVKALHIVFVTSWFAGLFYLPRIFVNLAMVEHAGCKPTNLHVIIQEVPKEDWALAGVMGDERKD